MDGLSQSPAYQCHELCVCECECECVSDFLQERLLFVVYISLYAIRERFCLIWRKIWSNFKRFLTLLKDTLCCRNVYQLIL